MDFGYNRESVKRVEEFIEEQRSNTAAEEADKLTQVLGSSLGESIIRTYGGVWRQEEEQWGVFFEDGNAVFPFSKVRKQFQNGLAGGDSILGLFELIGPVFIKKS
jgi:hypothetical protein